MGVLGTLVRVGMSYGLGTALLVGGFVVFLLGNHVLGSLGALIGSVLVMFGLYVTRIRPAI